MSALRRAIWLCLIGPPAFVLPGFFRIKKRA